jgi:hypothetical protein
MEEEPIDVDDGPEPEWAPPQEVESVVVKDPRDLSEDPIRHVYLFAKGHYQRSYDEKARVVAPMIEDLIRIMERAYGMEKCSPEDALKIIIPHVWDSMAGPQDFETMLMFLRTQVINIDKQEELKLMYIDEALCKMCLVIMAIRVTNGVLILGPADPKILTPTDGMAKKNFRRKNE